MDCSCEWNLRDIADPKKRRGNVVIGSLTESYRVAERRLRDGADGGTVDGRGGTRVTARMQKSVRVVLVLVSPFILLT